MTSANEIDAALMAHAQWKQRLRDAVETGRSDFDPVTVRRDDACDFGRWLYSLPRDEQATEDFARIRTLHSDFHRTAGDILDMALSGRGDEALKELDTGGSYGPTSGKLVLALQKWKSKS